MNALIVGCGSVGRGLLAPLLIRAGYAVMFVDSNRGILEQLKERLYYPTRTCWSDEIGWQGPCGSDFVLSSLDPMDMVFVCVRAENMASVGHCLKGVLGERESDKPLQIIVCENTPDAAGKMRAAAGTYQGVFYRSAIAECIIPEMPREIGAIDPLLTYVDPRGRLIVDGRNWQGNGFQIAGIEFSQDFEFDWGLKWYCHCALHAIVGLLGRKAGYTYVHEAMKDRVIRDRLLTLMGNAQRALETLYGKRTQEIKDRIWNEFAQLDDATRPDTCERVTRDLARKLQPGERLLDMLELVGGRSAVMEEVIEYGRRIVN